ncbi:MAG: 2-methylthioadenine synthetase, partial [Nitrososphaera sp.]|nr:2-methylthioadenine synthetase [Nitrososphaera sp.]
PQYVPDMLDKLVDVFYKNDKLFRFIHIPVQSGSNSVLRKMKRGHSADQFSEIVKAFRQKMPDFTVATDVIAGFPTETESDFQKTIDLLTDAEPDVINISKYSARPGTESASWKGVRINTETVKHRTERLHVLSRVITKRRNAIWNGWHGELIVDEVGKVVQGRNYAYKPIVLSEKADLGTKVKVQVYSHTALALKGRIAQHC